MRLKLRFRVVWAVLAAVGAAAVAVDAGTFAFPVHAAKPSREAAQACPRVKETSPYVAAAHFVHSAVSRQDLKTSYGLAGEQVRGSVTCAQWMHGRVPLRKVGDVDWARSGFQVVGKRAGEVMLRIVLYRATGNPVSFLLDVQKHGSGWLVGRIERDPNAVPAA